MRSKTGLRIVAIGLLVATTACGGDDRRGGGESNVETDSDGGPKKIDPNDIDFEDTDAGVQAPSSGVCDAMDILFVIDNSGSMEPAQTSLKENFPRFMQVLSEFENEQGKQLDYRVAVTTTDVSYTEASPLGGSIDYDGNDGALVTGCDLAEPYVTRDLSDVATPFSCLASVGTSGSGLEMPVQALLMALENASNKAFFREEALLAVVILTDEDDCSRRDRSFDPSSAPLDALLDPAKLDAWLCGPDKLVPPEEITAALDAFKGERAKWALSVIGWEPGDASCEGKLHADSNPAAQLASVVTEAGENAIFSSICEEDLSSSLTDAMNNFNFACESFIR